MVSHSCRGGLQIQGNNQLYWKGKQIQSKSLSPVCCNTEFTGILPEGVDYLKKHICPIFPLRINFTASLVAFVLFFKLHMVLLSGVISPGQAMHLSASRSDLPRLPAPEPASGPEPAEESAAAVHSHSESAPSLNPVST